METRSLELLLPIELIGYEVSKWLTLESLLRMREVSQKSLEYANLCLAQELSKIPFTKLLNDEANQFIYLCSFIKRNPKLLDPLKNPEHLLELCTQLTPLGLLRLSIIFFNFPDKTYHPLKEIANSNEPNWLIAFIGCALFTPEIGVLSMGVLSQALQWLNSQDKKEKYRDISSCLATIERVRLLQTHVDFSQLPVRPCYLNLQRANLSAAQLRRVRLGFANLQGADVRYAQLQLSQLYGAYIKDIKHAEDCHPWDTHFFDLNDPTTNVDTQLAMLDCQLTANQRSTKLDEALAQDFLSQISKLDDPKKKLNALKMANQHHLFTSRAGNPSIKIAFHKAFREVATLGKIGLFNTSTVWPVRPKIAEKLQTLSSPLKPQ